MSYERVGGCPLCGAPIYGYEEIIDSSPGNRPVYRTCTCADWTGINKYMTGPSDHHDAGVALLSDFVSQIKDDLSAESQAKLIAALGTALAKMREIRNGPS